MDYRTVEPPAWDTALPAEWSDKAHKARAMARNASHYAPELVEMFDAWARAWNERYATWKAADDGARASAHAAVIASVEGRADDARRMFASAARAAETAREVRGDLLYRSFLETIPNGEEFQGVAR